ncbi:MAG TPA: hypothetical protein ENJ16_05650, partial [Planctomycetaceae bacterium]|nr:hypothetical protein [Planctomycetaceae bacterium]
MNPDKEPARGRRKLTSRDLGGLSEGIVRILRELKQNAVFAVAETLYQILNALPKEALVLRVIANEGCKPVKRAP